MSLLNRSNKTDTTALSQYIVDKYVRMISTSHFELIDIEFDTDKLYIHGDNDFYGLELSTRILQDMYDDIKKDFTIISNSSINICVDSNIDILEHVKIKCNNYCDITYAKAPNIGRKIKPQIELKNLNVIADTLYINLPLVKLTNVNIQVSGEFDLLTHNMETFKSISGNISAEKLNLMIKKSPLTRSLYVDYIFRGDQAYKQVMDTDFINLLDPDKFDVNTYHIHNNEFFSFYITKSNIGYSVHRHVYGKWDFIYSF